MRNAAGNVDFQEQRVTVSESGSRQCSWRNELTLTGASSPGTIFVLIPGTSIPASFRPIGGSVVPADAILTAHRIRLTDRLSRSANTVSHQRIGETPEGVMRRKHSIWPLADNDDPIKPAAAN